MGFLVLAGAEWGGGGGAADADIGIANSQKKVAELHPDLRPAPCVRLSDEAYGSLRKATRLTAGMRTLCIRLANKFKFCEFLLEILYAKLITNI